MLSMPDKWSCPKEVIMNIDRAVLTLAGSVVLISLVLAWLVSPYWLLLTAFVGDRLRASFTGWCPAALEAFR